MQRALGLPVLKLLYRTMRAILLRSTACVCAGHSALQSIHLSMQAVSSADPDCCNRLITADCRVHVHTQDWHQETHMKIACHQLELGPAGMDLAVCQSNHQAGIYKCALSTELLAFLLKELHLHTLNAYGTCTASLYLCSCWQRLGDLEQLSLILWSRHPRHKCVAELARSCCHS